MGRRAVSLRAELAGWVRSARFVFSLPERFNLGEP
jgi:hypothetical protein